MSKQRTTQSSSTLWCLKTQYSAINVQTGPFNSLNSVPHNVDNIPKSTVFKKIMSCSTRKLFVWCLNKFNSLCIYLWLVHGRYSLLIMSTQSQNLQCQKYTAWCQIWSFWIQIEQWVVTSRVNHIIYCWFVSHMTRSVTTFLNLGIFCNYANLYIYIYIS